MTVKELRDVLYGVSDDAEVYITPDFCFGVCDAMQAENVCEIRDLINDNSKVVITPAEMPETEETETEDG